jgi:AcrR family transcriptional regulator
VAALPGAEPVPRADAKRNRALLLEAARQTFAEGGIDVSAGEIARRAGVAKGTLFRHFPTKSELLAAVLIDRMAQLRVLIGEVTQERAAGLGAVAEIMRRGAEVLASDRSFFDAAMAHVDEDGSLRREKLALEAALDGLVAAAQAAREVRDDVSGVDLAMLMMAATNTCAPTGDLYPDLWRRYLALMIDSLRPGATTPLPVPAINGAEMAASARARPSEPVAPRC